MTSSYLNLPMLFGMDLGACISSHDGVRCYPAVRRKTGEKYILKVISIPASPSKLDALLLAGAMPSKKAALSYFMDLAKDVLAQAELLHSLSQQEGFVSYLDWDIAPMEDGIGYDVCLLGEEKNSLEQILQTQSLTHAEILHMGLDLCAALAACRRNGMLYVDLKPGNIFYSLEEGCRIGDVGFISLSSLKYTSLPEKYHCSYTPPELADDFAVPGTTMDTYALGLVLYQAYNGGVLPFTGTAPAEPLPSPLYADYEMAQILAKACHPDPEQRWQDPTQMAQALIGYMQEFGATEVPVIPVADFTEAEEDTVEEFLPEVDPEQLRLEMELLQEDELDTTALLAALQGDETTPGEDTTHQTDDALLSEELSAMLAQADELIAHPLPQVLAVPEPVEASTPAQQEPAVEEDDIPPAVEEKADENHEAEIVPADAPAKEKRTFHFPKRIAISLLLILLAIGLLFGGKHYYDNIYTLRVQSVILQQSLNTVTVRVQTDADMSLLRVVCTDSYGNSQDCVLTDGIAHFENLKPSTCYTIRITANGNHRVIGHISEIFSTPPQTNILSFIAGIGPEDCSVSLYFTASGPQNDNWVIRYSANGTQEMTHSFTGNSTIIYGLTEGANYTFTLESNSDLNVAGNNQVQYKATNILLAKDLEITACGEGSLTVQWQQPDNGTVAMWRVRCYNEAGFDLMIETDQCNYTFTGLTQEDAYTVEVMAVGMNRSVSTYVEADPTTIRNFTYMVTEELGLLFTWEHIGPMPVGGWMICYTIGDGPATTVVTEENSLLLMLLPQGNYSIHFIAAPGTRIFQDSHNVTLTELTSFEGYGITATEMQSFLCMYPQNSDWQWDALLQDNYRTTFTYGENAGILIRANTVPEDSENSVNVQFVICDADGVPMRMDSATMLWSGLWQEDLCCLAFPYLPEHSGSYTLLLYFDGQLVCHQDFTIT